MNIFILDNDPKVAAVSLCDKHLIKMILETAQLLCSQHEPGTAPYKRTHYNHPSSKWTRESEANYRWLIKHGLAMCSEYTTFYGRRHKSQDIIEWAEEHTDRLRLPQTGMTPFAQAMPDEYRKKDAVEAYRAYYRGDKADIAVWSRGRKVPDWWNQ